MVRDALELRRKRDNNHAAAGETTPATEKRRHIDPVAQHDFVCDEAPHLPMQLSAVAPTLAAVSFPGAARPYLEWGLRNSTTHSLLEDIDLLDSLQNLPVPVMQWARWVAKGERDLAAENLPGPIPRDALRDLVMQWVDGRTHPERRCDGRTGQEKSQRLSEWFGFETWDKVASLACGLGDRLDCPPHVSWRRGALAYFSRYVQGLMLTLRPDGPLKNADSELRKRCTKALLDDIHTLLNMMRYELMRTVALKINWVQPVNEQIIGEWASQQEGRFYLLGAAGVHAFRGGLAAPQSMYLTGDQRGNIKTTAGQRILDCVHDLMLVKSPALASGSLKWLYELPLEFRDLQRELPVTLGAIETEVIKFVVSAWIPQSGP